MEKIMSDLNGTTIEMSLAADAASNALAPGMQWYVVQLIPAWKKAAERNIVERINRAGMQSGWALPEPTEKW
jgi:transcriptional antiterminator NusG